MSRLYYPSSKNTIAPNAIGATAGSVNTASNSSLNTSVAEVLEKVSRMIPGEIIAGYLILVGLVPAVQIEAARPWLNIFNFLLCLGLTPLYLWKVSDRSKPFPRNHLIVSSIAFIVWAYATSGNMLIPQLFDQAISSILLIIFTLISAVVPMES